MSFFVEDKGGQFTNCPAGMHLGRCYRVIDLGTQKSVFKGQTKFLHKVRLIWEIHGTDDNGKQIAMNDGRPFSISKNYTLSWSDKANLRIDLQSWRGRPFTHEEMRRFDLKNILGAWCMLNVIETIGTDGRTYTNVDSVTPVPPIIKQNGIPEGVNKLEIFNMDNPDLEMFESFHDRLKETIRQSPEWAKIESKNTAAPAGEPADESFEDEEIPF